MLIASTISSPSQPIQFGENEERKKALSRLDWLCSGATPETSIEHLLRLPHVTLFDCRHIELLFLVSQLCCSANAFQFGEMPIQLQRIVPERRVPLELMGTTFLGRCLSARPRRLFVWMDAPPECAPMHIVLNEKKKGKQILGKVIIMQNIRLKRKTATLRSNKMSMNEFKHRPAQPLL